MEGIFAPLHWAIKCDGNLIRPDLKKSLNAGGLPKEFLKGGSALNCFELLHENNRRISLNYTEMVRILGLITYLTNNHLLPRQTSF